MIPRQDGCLFTITLKIVPSTFFIFSGIWQFEVRSIAGQRELEKVVISGAVVELNKAAETCCRNH